MELVKRKPTNKKKQYLLSYTVTNASWKSVLRPLNQIQEKISYPSSIQLTPYLRKQDTIWREYLSQDTAREAWQEYQNH